MYTSTALPSLLEASVRQHGAQQGFRQPARVSLRPREMLHHRAVQDPDTPVAVFRARLRFDMIRFILLTAGALVQQGTGSRLERDDPVLQVLVGRGHALPRPLCEASLRMHRS